MLWETLAANPITLHFLTEAADTASPPPDLLAYAIRYGPGAVIALGLGVLMKLGYRLESPKAAAEREEAIRKDARADLLEQKAADAAENARLRADLKDVTDERNELLRQALPLLTEFNSWTRALVPILQTMVGQGWHRGRRDDDERPGGSD